MAIVGNITAYLGLLLACTAGIFYGKFGELVSFTNSLWSQQGAGWIGGLCLGGLMWINMMENG